MTASANSESHLYVGLIVGILSIIAVIFSVQICLILKKKQTCSKRETLFFVNATFGVWVSLYKILITQYYEINCLLNLVHCFRLTGYSKMESCTCNSNLSFLRTIDTQLFWFVPILEHPRQSMQNAMKFWGDTQGNGLWRCTVLISRTKWTSFPVISYM